MAETNSFELPSWVSKRDGHLVAFDADEICQTIFAGTEDLGQPNAFLAREMTESVLHFLSQEHGTGTPTTAQVADLVTKVLRELGQPDLAQAVERGAGTVNRGPWTDQATVDVSRSTVHGAWSTASADLPLSQFMDQCRRAFSLQAVFSRDVVAAQDEGWLTLVGLEHPAELEGGVVDWPGGADRSLLSAMVQARRRFGSFIALDSPEQALGSGQWPVASGQSLLTTDHRPLSAAQWERHVADFVGDLKDGLQATGLHAVINLNVAQPPAWVEQPGDGPLFRPPARSASDGTASAFSLLGVLVEQFPEGEERIRVDWHLGERDFAASSQDDLLKVVRKLGVGRGACGGGRGEREKGRRGEGEKGDGSISPFLPFSPSPLLPPRLGPPATFVFDRPRMPVALGEGLDRQHPAVLQVAGLHLGPLLDMPGVEGNMDLLLEKLVHLTRMAVSAGTQKRHFLRRQAEHQGGLQRGFLLDRARLAVIPVGLAAVVQREASREHKRPELARQIVQRLRQCLIESGRCANLEAVLDSPWWTMNRGPWTVDRGPTMPRSTVHGPRPTISPHLAGLTCADFTLSAEDQLRAAGMLHQLTGTGTATVLVPADVLAKSERVVQLLRYAWAKTDIVRLRFARIPAAVEEAEDLLTNQAKSVP